MLLENIYVQLLIVGLILLFVYFQLTRSQIKLNEPPLAYYRFPIIGHTWRYLNDCRNLMLESQEKYGETFSLYVFGKIMTVSAKDTAYEVFKKVDDFSLYEGTKEQFPTNDIFNHTSSEEKRDKPIKILKDVMGNMNNFTSRLQQNIAKAIDISIGDCVEPKVIRNPVEFITNLTALLIANVIFGEDCYYYEELLETTKNILNSVFKFIVLSKIFKIFSHIHPWVGKQFTKISLKSVSKHNDVIMKHIKPVIKKRLDDKKKLGDAWIAPLDALQVCLDDPEITPDLDPNNVDYNVIVEVLEILIFTAIISLPAAVFYALYDLAGRKEYWNELYEEAQVINKQCNGNKLKSDDPDKMVKLDKFVKESLRLNIDITNVAHKCISKPYYTFENGYQVPNGRMVYLNFMSLAIDEELQGQNSKEFYAYRHVSPATKLEHNYLVFGSGKHACPGRFLAVNVPKIFLHMVMLKYNVRTENGKMKPPKYAGPTVRPFNVGIVFENRN